MYSNKTFRGQVFDKGHLFQMDTENEVGNTFYLKNSLKTNFFQIKMHTIKKFFHLCRGEKFFFFQIMRYTDI